MAVLSTFPKSSLAAQLVVRSSSRSRSPAGLRTEHLRHRSEKSIPSASPLVHEDVPLPSSPPLLSWREKATMDEEKVPLLSLYSTASVPRLSIRRRWFSILILVAASTSIFLIFSVFDSSTTYPTTLPTLLARIPFTPSHSSRSCEPYSSAGRLAVDSSDPDKNHWVPTDRKCLPPSLFSDLRDLDATNTDFSFLHNRTALVIGDSVSREQVENFCGLMGQEYEVVRKNHKLSPRAGVVRPPSKSTQAVEKPARLAARSRVSKDASLPRICYIPSLDFMLVSVFHFGIDQEDYFREKGMPQYSSPGMFEHRLSDIIQPLIDNLRKSGRTTAPDYVEVSSSSFDLARFALQDIANSKDTETGLSPERVTYYRHRVGQVFEKVRKAFPAATKTWRTLAYPQDQAAEYDYFMDKISAPRSTNSTLATPSYFSHKRISQLDDAIRSLVVPTIAGDITIPAPHSDFRLNEWGSIMRGQEAHQKDRLHGQPLPGSYVWGDILLYEMARGLGGKF